MSFGAQHQIFSLFALYLGYLYLYLHFGIAAVRANDYNTDIAGLKNIGQDFVIIILNENHPYHLQKAKLLRSDLLRDALANDLNISVKIASKDFKDVGYWIYLPLAEVLINGYEKKGQWYVFIEEFCVVDLKQLYLFLQDKDSSQDLFYGKALRDEEATIIHHFDAVQAEKDPFLYPDPRTGIIVSHGLLEKIATEWDPARARIDFSIDAAYEFSKVVSSLDTYLRHSDGLCVEQADSCHVWSQPNGAHEAPDIPLDRIHFGVKTCQKLASERLPVLKDTWLPRVSNYALYSDVEDETSGTISLNIPNSERGHCRKTLGIIRRAAQMDIDWLVIADDDTLLSPPRLASLLGAYDPSSPLALGERYAYMIGSGAGFNYLTGGAGMVLSKRTVSLLSEEGACDCPSSETPDDMYLGACLQRQQVPIIHSRRFHQARPDDYAPSLLKGSSPISFHKYWMVDPRQVYSRWLIDQPKLRHPQTHQEL